MSRCHDGFTNGLARVSAAIAMVTVWLVMPMADVIAQGSQGGKVVEYDIPAQSLETALQVVADRLSLQILYSPGDLKGVSTRGLKGAYSTKEAIDRLIEGTGLTASFNGQNAVAIRPRGDEKKTGAQGGASNARPTVVAQAQEQSESATTLERTTSEAGDEEGRNATERDQKSGPLRMEKIEVTGTHISSVVPIAPIMTISRDEIEHSGYQSVGEVMRALPQNAGGGQNIGNIGAQGSGNTLSVSLGSTANLRGLGSDASLSLINGHRLAYDGNSNGTDISIIPLAAVERIEVLTDGASAVYGSDAVAGVVNFILRRDFEGAETQVTLGNSSNGGGATRRLSQLFGRAWQSGNLVLAYEHTKETAVSADQRSFTSTLNPRTLLPDARKDSLFATFNQELNARTSAFLEGVYTDRNAHSRANSRGILSSTDYDVSQYGATGGLKSDLPGAWHLALTGNISRSDDKSLLTYDAGAPAQQANTFQNKLESIEAAADGPLASLPTGIVNAAFGAGGRHEDFLLVSTNPVNTDAGRRVKYLYGEVRIPVISSRASHTGPNILEVSLAGRHEDYSDFGTTTNPKVGLLYAPTTEIRMRTSWGTSFRAPALFQKYSPGQLYLFKLPDPTSSTGSTNTLFTIGPNPNLGAEKSKSWTAGIDFNPSAHRDLSVGITYFRINYRDRISLPATNPFAGLVDPTLAAFVTRNPSPALQAQLLAQAQLFNNFSGAPYNPALVGAYFNGIYQNLSQQLAQGVDALITRTWSSPQGKFEATLNATYLDLRQQILSSLPRQTISGTVFNPPRTRMRSGLAWTKTALSASVAMNYVGSERDPFAVPAQRISSWTTFDAQAGYRFQKGTHLEGVQIGVFIRNVFDKDPPFVRSATTTVPGLNYDTANTSPIGRFFGLTVKKQW